LKAVQTKPGCIRVSFNKQARSKNYTLRIGYSCNKFEHTIANFGSGESGEIEVCSLPTKPEYCFALTAHGDCFETTSMVSYFPASKKLTTVSSALVPVDSPTSSPSGTELVSEASDSGAITWQSGEEMGQEGTDEGMIVASSEEDGEGGGGKWWGWILGKSEVLKVLFYYCSAMGALGSGALFFCGEGWRGRMSGLGVK
jgi:hypothetical protein